MDPKSGDQIPYSADAALVAIYREDIGDPDLRCLMWTTRLYAHENFNPSEANAGGDRCDGLG